MRLRTPLLPVHLLAVLAAVLLAGQALSHATDQASNVVPMPVQTSVAEWQPLTDPIEGPDGTLHTDCKVLVSEPASTVVCADGFTETS